jgi:glycosyltransferase involved in cell wall biosynthesis
MAAAGGGLEQYLLQLSDELDRAGHHNLLLYGEKTRGEPLPIKAKFYLLNDITHPRCHDSEKKLAAVGELIASERPDLAFFHQVLNPALVDRMTRALPSIRFAHDFKLICPDGRKTLKPKGGFCQFPLSYLCQVRAYRYRCMPRNLFQGVPAISGAKSIARIHKERSYTNVASQFMKKVMLCNGFEEERIAVIPPFTTLPDLESYDSADDPPMIISVGRIVKEKGMDYLLHAFTSVKGKARLTVIGDGPFLGELKSLAQRLGILPDVSFPGWLAPNELKSYYRKCDMVVVPSTWPEPFGMVGIEAMSYGKPVLAFDVGGISEWLKHEETGFLVKPKDTVALAERMSFLLERPDLARSIGNKGREAVAVRFVPSAHVDQLLSVFHQAIDFFKKNPNLGSRSESKQ